MFGQPVFVTWSVQTVPRLWLCSAPSQKTWTSCTVGHGGLNVTCLSVITSSQQATGNSMLGMITRMVMLPDHHLTGTPSPGPMPSPVTNHSDNLVLAQCPHSLSLVTTFDMNGASYLAMPWHRPLVLALCPPVSFHQSQPLTWLGHDSWPHLGIASPVHPSPGEVRTCGRNEPSFMCPLRLVCINTRWSYNTHQHTDSSHTS